MGVPGRCGAAHGQRKRWASCAISDDAGAFLAWVGSPEEHGSKKPHGPKSPTARLLPARRGRARLRPSRLPTARASRADGRAAHRERPMFRIA